MVGELCLRCYQMCSRAMLHKAALACRLEAPSVQCGFSGAPCVPAPAIALRAESLSSTVSTSAVRAANKLSRSRSALTSCSPSVRAQRLVLRHQQLGCGALLRAQHKVISLLEHVHWAGVAIQLRRACEPRPAPARSEAISWSDIDLIARCSWPAYGLICDARPVPHNTATTKPLMPKFI